MEERLSTVFFGLLSIVTITIGREHAARKSGVKDTSRVSIRRPILPRERTE